eukprot:83079-Amphidinium_carterae.1
MRGTQSSGIASFSLPSLAMGRTASKGSPGGLSMGKTFSANGTQSMQMGRMTSGTQSMQMGRIASGTASLSLPSLGTMGKAPSIPQTPLNEQLVAHASESCAALYRWMLELVQEHMERLRLLEERQQLADSLRIAKVRVIQAEQEAADLETSVSKLRLAVTLAEEALRILQQEEAEALKAIKGIQKLDAMGTPKGRVPTLSLEADAPRPRKVKDKPVEQVELELSSTLAVIEQQLAQLRVDFDHGKSSLLE